MKVAQIVVGTLMFVSLIWLGTTSTALGPDPLPSISVLITLQAESMLLVLDPSHEKRWFGIWLMTMEVIFAIFYIIEAAI